jgi:type IV secretion system protein VirD4
MSLTEELRLFLYSEYFVPVILFWSIAVGLVVLWAIAAYRKRKRTARLLRAIIVIGAAVVWILATWEDLNQKEGAGHLSLEDAMLSGFLLLMVGFGVYFLILFYIRQWGQEAQVDEALGIAPEPEEGWVRVRWAVFGISSLLCGWWWFNSGGAAPLVVDGIAGLLLLSMGQRPKSEETAEGNPRDARESGYEELKAAGYLNGQGIRLGYVLNPSTKKLEVIRYNGEAALALVAAQRTGKARDILIPALLEYKHSCVVIDPKGELCAVVGRQRAKFGRVIVLSPFRDDVASDNIASLPPELKRWPAAQYDPLAKLNPRSVGFGPNCDTLANALVMESPDGKGNHWVSGARQLISGLIMSAALSDDKIHRNLRTVSHILTLEDEELSGFARSAAQRFGGMVAERLRAFAGVGGERQKNEGELRSIMSTARIQAGFLANDAIGESLAGSSFRFADLKDEPHTVFVILPLRYMNTCWQWFALVLGSAIDEFKSRPGYGRVPVLGIIDEFAQLGRLDVMQTGIADLAGFGLQLWPVLQDIGQLNRLYGHDGAQTFLSGFAVKQFFAPRDPATASFVANECGERIFVRSNASVSTNSGGMSVSRGTSETREPLFLPHQIRQLEPECSWLFMENVPNVMRAGRLDYRRIAEFKGLWDANPYHKNRRT